jgi:hypothetical protein
MEVIIIFEKLIKDHNMKKSIFLLLAVGFLIVYPASSQKSGLLKKVTKSMSDELLGKPAGNTGNNAQKQAPEPPCACDQPEIVMDLTSNELDYKESSISIMDDGSLLAHHNGSDEYYVVKNGVTKGPFKSNDPAVTAFSANVDESGDADAFTRRYKSYISKSGGKYLITFNGKSYGPYAIIKDFAVSKSKEKFAAMVIENVAVTEDQGKKMEEAMKNAKSDQERMELAMQFSQQMQQKMMQGGGVSSTLAKLVSNIPNINYDPYKPVAGFLNSNVKYDDILFVSYDKVSDLQGKVLLTIKPEFASSKDLFINTGNSKYASYYSGTLTFSDNTKMSDLFNPHLVKVGGQVYLAYMYFSPKRNAIAQCKIPF